jgi:hypothetical protein
MKQGLVAMVLCCFILVSTGCTKLKAFFGNNEAMFQLTTEAATARLVTEHPTWKAPIINITDAAMSAIANGSAVTLEGVSAFVVSKIDMSKLKPEDRVLVSWMIARIVNTIVEDLKKSGSYDPASQIVEVNKVLGWVNATAKLY